MTLALAAEADVRLYADDDDVEAGEITVAFE